MSRRSLLLTGLLAAAVAALAFACNLRVFDETIGHVRRIYNDHRVLQPFDYLEYWSAGRAAILGQNPYDGRVLYALQQGITAWDEPIMMWNPPWTLPLAMAVGTTHWRTGQLIWFAMSIAAVIASVVWLWRMFGGDDRRQMFVIGVGFVFAPTLFMLLMGQITGFMLLGLVGFVWFQGKSSPSPRVLLAGVLVALTSVKPHLLAPFAVILLAEAVRSRTTRRAVIAGAIAIVLFGVVPLLWNADVWGQYFESTRARSSATHHTISDWEHATLGYSIRHALPGRPFAAMFIPLAIAIPSVLVYWCRRRLTWDWVVELPRLVIVSLIAAPYGAWGNDLVLLLVPVIQAAGWVIADRRLVLQASLGIVYVIFNLALLSTVTREHSMCNPWIVPVSTLGYVLVGWLTRSRVWTLQTSAEQSSSSAIVLPGSIQA